MRPSRQWLCGWAEVSVTGLRPVVFLNRCVEHNIPFEQAEPMDECTLRVFLPNRLTAEAQSVAGRCGCTLEILRRRGGQPVLHRLRRRLVLLVSAVMALGLLFCSTLFIWDIQVADNDSALADREILQVLEDAGVGIGTFWPGLSSDMIRAAVLSDLPELQWLAVNVRGSRAQVVVRPAVEVPPLREEDGCVRIVAEHSGVIESIHVQEGEALVGVGDAVLAGDELVSGLRSGGAETFRPVRARADVVARTWYEFTVQTPLERCEKHPTGRKKHRFALIFGKRRINFYFDSGILPGECDKITRIRPLEWEGVFTLPLALVTETLIPWTGSAASWPEEALAHAAEDALIEALERQLGEKGEIAALHFDRAVVGDMLVVTLRCECLQPIAREEPVSLPTDTNEPVEDTVWTEPSQWIG